MLNNLKKLFLSILVLVISSVFVFAENIISLGEISFVCPENVYLEMYSAKSNKKNSYFTKTVNKGSYLLTVNKFTFDEFVKYQEKNEYHTVTNAKNYDVYKQNCLKNQSWFENGPSEKSFQQVYESKGLLIATSWQLTSLWYVSNIGNYEIAVFGDDFIYLFAFYFTNISNSADDKIFKQLDKIVYLAFPGAKASERGEERSEGWKFNIGQDESTLYKAIKEKSSGVKEIDEYQRLFEKILNSIESTVLVKTLDNIRIRKTYNLSDESLVTVKKGETIKILEKTNKFDSIDGLYDCWYKVSVPKGTLNRDGKEIETEITGYCYGGYLGK